MLFVIVFIIAVIGIIVCCVGDVSELYWLLTAIGTTVAGVAVVAMLIHICHSYSTADGYSKSMQARYDSLVYQYENNIYDNDLGKRDLMVDIQKWNEDLAYRKTVQKDLWIGIFYPNIYDQFEFIELE